MPFSDLMPIKKKFEYLSFHESNQLKVYLPKPNEGEGAAWYVASRHLLKSIRGRIPDLQGTLGLISWSGSTIAYTCTLSNSSELSHRILDIFILRISPSCSTVKLDGHPPFSYQNRSPCRKLWNCLPMMHARVGPTSDPEDRFFTNYFLDQSKCQSICHTNSGYEYAFMPGQIGFYFHSNRGIEK